MADPRYSLFAARAVFDPRLTATDVRVLAALGTYTNKQGWCHPKQETIALRVGLKRPTVVVAIKRLANLGYLELQAQTAPGRGRTTNKYRVKLDIEEPMSAEITSGADVRWADVGEPDIGGADVIVHRDPMSAQDDTHKEHSQENIPNVAVAVRGIDLLDGLKARADGAINLTSGHVHHAGELSRLLRGGCTVEDIENATDAITASFKAKGRLFNSWAIISELAVENRDRRLAGVRAPQPVTDAPRARPGKVNTSEIIRRVFAEEEAKLCQPKT